MSQTNVDLIRGVYDAFGRGDVSTVLAAFDPRIEWNEAENFPYADGNPYVGPQAVAEGVFQRLGTEWEGWSLAVERVLDAGDNVVVLGRYQARHPGTGRDLDAQFAHVWSVRDGKAIRFQQYADTAQTRQVMGLLD